MKSKNKKLVIEEACKKKEGEKNTTSDNKKKKVDYEEYLDTALLAGQIALGNGAETMRCEDTMDFILSQSGSKNYTTSVVSTTIFACIESEAKLASIKRWDTDLNKICLTNEVSRNLCAGKISIQEAKETLQNIKSKSVYKFPLRLAAFIMIGAFLPIFSNGDWQECMAGALCGVVMALANTFFKHVHIRYFIINMMQSIFMVLATYFVAYLTKGEINTEIVVAASIAPMLPGLAMTNAVRDTIQGDYVSGSGRLMEATVKTLSLVLGVTVGLIIGQYIPTFGSSTEEVGNTIPSLGVLILASLLVSAGYCIIMEVSPKFLIFAACIGAFGRLTYMFLVQLEISDIIAVFIATVIITFLAQISARIAKAPTSLFLISGIMLLVPGTFMYDSVTKFLGKNNAGGLESLLTTLFIAGAISLAIFLVDTVFISISLAKQKKLIEK